MNELPEKVKIETDSPSAGIQEALKKLIPGAMNSDGSIDARLLSDLAGLEVSGLKGGTDRFGLMWAGRANSVAALNANSHASLVPINPDSQSWDQSEHVFIEGDNLECLKLLQKAYNDKVKLIYIDPPYNTGSDFVYKDDFSDSIRHYLEVTGQSDSEGNRLVANSEVLGRKHSNWLNMMFPRLVLARNLLSDDGLIFISIDDNEYANLTLIMDEIFGSENRRGVFIWKKKGTSTNVVGVQVSSLTEYIVCYGRSMDAKIAQRITSTDSRSYPYRDETGDYRLTVIEKKASGIYDRATMKFPILGIKPRAGKRWQLGEEKARELESLGRFVIDGKGVIKLKIYKSEEGETASAQPNLLLEHGSTQTGQAEVDALVGPGVFDNPKPVSLMRHILKLGNVGPGEVVLDFFAGSGSMGEAVIRENLDDGGARKFVLITLGEETAPNSAAHQRGFKKVSEITVQRLNKVIELLDESNLISFRQFKLAPSAFVSLQPDQSDESLFFENTLVAGSDPAHVAAEALLKHGVTLDKEWIRGKLGETIFTISDAVGIILNTQYSEKVLEESQRLEVATVIFLEDSFAGNDPIKVGAFHTFKQANITMKTI